MESPVDGEAAANPLRRGKPGGARPADESDESDFEARAALEIARRAQAAAKDADKR